MLAIKLQRPRLLLAVFTLCLFFATGCSGDDDEGQIPDLNGVDVSDGDHDGDFDGDGDTGDGTGPGDSGDGDADSDGDRSPGGGQDWDWDEEEFSLLAVSPARGPLAGGTYFQISGQGLSSDTQILFDQQPVPVTVSQGHLVGQTPRADSPGPVTVRAISGDGEVVELQNGFTYSDGLTVHSATPRRVPTTGGVEITLQGRGFVDSMGVSFSGTPARRIDVINGQQARVIVPPRARGHADLRVSIPDESVLLKDEIFFFAPLNILEAAPGAGHVSGNELVTLRIEGLTPQTAIYFDDLAADIQSINIAAGTATVVTPAAAGPGFVDLLVENDDTSALLKNGFYYDQAGADALYAVHPARAPTTGQTEHLVSGRGLDASGVSIYLGGQAATIVESGPAFARITAPPAAAGSVDLVFFKNGAEIDRLEEAFEYVPAVQLDEISPATGHTNGGEVVNLFGENLSAVTSVSIGGLPASFTVIDDAHLSVTTPRAEPGLVDVTVRGAAGFTATLEQAFRYEAPVELWSMRPSRGAIAGGTQVTLQGRGFDGLIEVEVGGLSGTEIRRLDPYTVTFRTPPSSAGPKNVKLRARGEEKQTPYPYVYFNPMSSFGGASGPPVDGAVNVSVITNAGTPVPGAFVMLSTRADTPFKGFTNQNGQVTLSGANVLGAQTVTATAAGFSAVTVRHVNAQNLTLIVNPLEADGGGGQGVLPPMARISGNITITGKSEDPGGGVVYNMSMVRTTRTHTTGGMMNPGPDSIVAGEGAFSINTRVGDMALIGLCGVYDPATDVFEPKLMAVERFLFLSDGDHQQVDLQCDIPLESSLGIKIVDPVFAPDGPSINEATAFLDFGFEGVFRIPDSALGLSDLLQIENLPALEGVLLDVSYTVMAGSYNGIGVPYTQTTLSGITDLSRLHSTPPLVGVPELVSPAPGGFADGGFRIGLKGVNRPDLYYIVMRNAMGLPVWSFIVPGYEELVPLPEFPDFAELPAESRPEPFQPGTLYTVVYGIRIKDFDYHGFTYSDFTTSRWSAFSVATWHMRLTP